MKRSPRPADVSTSREEQGIAELPRFDGPGVEVDHVARRAYERYEARGREDGRDMEDWLEAERELLQSPSSTNTATNTARSDD